jgi:cytoskeletal protein RodZ
MEKPGQQLRLAREAQGLSIEQIEEMTLINARHLEAIERGEMDTLPRPYIRAFMREYAAVVGLDPLEILRGLDEPEDTQTVIEAGSPEASLTPPDLQQAESIASRVLGSTALRIAGAAVLFIVGAIALVVLNDRSPEQEVREIPFGNVIREHEQRSEPPGQPAAPSSPAPATSDSLTLSAVVSDTLWMKIVVDDGPPREYLARPGFRASWKARSRFVVSAGNAGVATWTLNGKPLGPLGKPGTVVRNRELTRASLAGR